MLWGQLAHPWQICIEEAWAAYCAGSLPIGAAIIDTHGQVVARGRNRVFETHATSSFLAGTRLAHAEINALATVAQSSIDLTICTLYTTTEPCPMCIGAIRMSHIGTVRYIIRDPIAGSVGLLQANAFMQARPCIVIPFVQTDLEAALNALYVDWVLQDAKSRIIAGLDALAQQSPQGVALGRMLFQQHTVQRLRAEGQSAAAMLTIVMSMMPPARNE
jgi:tRNA(adenine34) deaminase